MEAASHSRALRLKIRLGEPRLQAAATAFWTHPELKRMLPEFLVLLHSIIRASVPLMQAAEAEARRRAPTDPLAAGVADYLATHVVEEQDHDLWLLADIEAAGVPREEALRFVPPPAVASLVGSQYYWSLHAHPVALLGYLAVLEGDPPDVRQLEEIERRTGFPRAVFRTMHKHAVLDPHHRDDLDRRLDRLPLQPHHAELVAVSAFQTIEFVGRTFEHLLERGGDRRVAAGARA